MQIVAMMGLSYPAVRATIDRFDAGGWSAYVGLPWTRKR